MSRYIFQLRRGSVKEWDTYEDTKYIQTQRYVSTTTYYLDKDGTIAEPQPTQSQVENGGYYIKNSQYLPPLDGELVLVYDNGTPRLKIGDGETDCSSLPYMGLDSFILPTSTTINLQGGAAWVMVSENRYTQDITDQLMGRITKNSKVDLQPTPEQLLVFHEKDVAFTTVNDNGEVRVCAIGIRPEQDYENIQVTITEVDVNG